MLFPEFGLVAMFDKTQVSFSFAFYSSSKFGVNFSKLRSIALTTGGGSLLPDWCLKIVYLLLVGRSYVILSASGEHDLNVITCSLPFGFLSFPSLLLPVDFLPARSVNGPVDG